MHLNHIDSLNQRIISLRDRIDSVIAPPARRIDLLTSVPGVSKTVAEIIIAETGADMTPSRTAPHLASWAGGNRDGCSVSSSEVPFLVTWTFSTFTLRSVACRIGRPWPTSPAGH
jgi:hypothetical protein